MKNRIVSLVGIMTAVVLATGCGGASTADVESDDGMQTEDEFSFGDDGGDMAGDTAEAAELPAE
ncbi:MAG: hypothetical protein J5802_12870 [Butyrivibrio sp.]|nr:hypothetical protein [Butyrivibrio sp.]